MENRIDILNELKELSPVMAAMEKVNIFTVPNGYFESLGEIVLMSIKEETRGLPGSIASPSSMQVPHGYFESLADNILNRIKAQDNSQAELKELSPLLFSIQNKNVFIAPQGYFELLADNILNQAKTQDDLLRELKELSPMLYSIQNENVFTIPQGYFESFSDNVLGKVKTQHAKVITMRRRTATVLKYAVAAVFTGVMALGVFKFVDKGITPPAGNTLTVAQAKGLEIAKENRFEEEFAKVSDDEIDNFLTKDGVDVDAAVAVSQVQDKIDAQENNTDKTESNEIDELLNQLDDNKTLN